MRLDLRAAEIARDFHRHINVVPKATTPARGTRSWRTAPMGALIKGFAAASTDRAYPRMLAPLFSNEKEKAIARSSASVFAPGAIRPSSFYGQSLRSPSLTARRVRCLLLNQSIMATLSKDIPAIRTLNGTRPALRVSLENECFLGD